MIYNEKTGHSGTEHLEAVSAYYDGELSAAESENIKKHIEECDECRAFYEDLARISGASEKAEIPPELHASIMRAVNGEKRRKPIFNVRRISALCGAGIAAMLCISLISGPFFGVGFSEKNAAGSAEAGARDMSIAREADADGADVGSTGEYSYYSSDEGTKGTNIQNSTVFDDMLSDKVDDSGECEAEVPAEDAEESAWTSSEIPEEKTEAEIPELGLFFPSRDTLGEYYK